jgi:hypothetical protein
MPPISMTTLARVPDFDYAARDMWVLRTNIVDARHPTHNVTVSGLGWAVGNQMTSGETIPASGPGASEDVGVFRKEPQRSVGEPVDLLDPETGGLDCRGGVPVGLTAARRTRP